MSRKRERGLLILFWATVIQVSLLAFMGISDTLRYLGYTLIPVVYYPILIILLVLTIAALVHVNDGWLARNVTLLTLILGMVSMDFPTLILVAIFIGLTMWWRKNVYTSGLAKIAFKVLCSCLVLLLVVTGLANTLLSNAKKQFLETQSPYIPARIIGTEVDEGALGGSIKLTYIRTYGGIIEYKKVIYLGDWGERPNVLWKSSDRILVNGEEIQP